MLAHKLRRYALRDFDFSSVQLLLHGDGEDASTTITDSSSFGRTITRAGNIQIDTAQSKFGGASILSDGFGDYLTCDGQITAPGTGDYTIEMWFRTTTTNNNGFLIDTRNTAGDNGPFYIARLGTVIAFGYGTTNRQSSAISTNTWHHVAHTRQSGTIRCFLDGVKQGADIAYATSMTSTTVTIGMSGFSRTNSSTNNFNGHIDELRISAVCRYTADFTPPTAPFLDR
jgi:hypothetical protein